MPGYGINRYKPCNAHASPPNNGDDEKALTLVALINKVPNGLNGRCIMPYNSRKVVS